MESVLRERGRHAELMKQRPPHLLLLIPSSTNTAQPPLLSSPHPVILSMSARSITGDIHWEGNHQLLLDGGDAPWRVAYWAPARDGFGVGSKVVTGRERLDPLD